MKAKFEIDCKNDKFKHTSELTSGTLFYHPHDNTNILMRTNNGSKSGSPFAVTVYHPYAPNIGDTYMAFMDKVELVPKGACVHLVQE